MLYQSTYLLLLVSYFLEIGDKIGPFNTKALTTKLQIGSVYYQEEVLRHIKMNY